MNGEEVVRHRGGFTPFSANLHHVAKPGEEATIVVRARDTHRGPQARGKQSQLYFNHSCLYTRTTGIWQTVWLEAVPTVHLKRPRITPDVAGSSFHLEVPVSANKAGCTIKRHAVKDADGEIVSHEVRADLDLAPAPDPAGPGRPRPSLGHHGSAPVRRTPRADRCRRQRGRRSRLATPDCGR